MNRSKSILAVLAACCAASGCAVYEGPVASRPYYYEPAPVYAASQPVYVTSQPVYVTPQPVYVSPQPVYVGPQPVYVGPPVRFGLSLGWHNGHRGHWHGRGRYRY